MKKSGSIFDSLRPPNSTRRVKQPGKPPPPPPQTQSAPNYMKSTSSSDAKKEPSQVSAKSFQDSLHVKNSKRSSKHSLASSNNKATRTLAKPSGSKKMRTLTKNPSFKPARSLLKKRTKVVLCENLDVHRATCSSTLKDCKLPACLMLKPGGTELEGVSALKVCPYTYCSLNGHYHEHLPSLKSFLSSRRRMIKAQRNMKLGELDGSMMCALDKKEKNGFFIESYGGVDGIDSRSVSNEVTVEVRGSDENVAQEDGEKVLEAISGGSIGECISFLKNFDENIDADSPDTDVDAYLEGTSQPSSAQEETTLGILNDFSTENVPSVQLYDLYSEASDMVPYQDVDYEYLSNVANEFDQEVCEKTSMQEFINKSVEFLANEESKETFSEESLNYDALSSNDDCDSVVSFEYTSVPVSREEAEATYEDEDDFEFENNDTPRTIAHSSDTNTDASHNLTVDKAISLDHPKYGCLSNEDIIEKECNLMLAELNPMEAEDLMVLEAKSESRNKAKGAFLGRNQHQDLILNDRFTKETAKCKRAINESEEEGRFNPRAPNFLPIQSVPEAEKVDLKHQELDEKKNAEEWMVDYALRQTVTKLGPACKKKVVLLVEAFEKVMPTTNWEMNKRHSSTFEHSRPIQTCK